MAGRDRLVFCVERYLADLLSTARIIHGELLELDASIIPTPKP